MRRRDIVKAVAALAANWPLATQAARKSPTLGFMGSATQSAWRDWTDAFVKRLAEHGWLDGRTISIEFRWGEGRADRFAAIAQEFVQLKVDAILTFGNAVKIVREATSEIPIVFAIAKDPVGNGFVRSLARPGANVTGLSIQANDTTSKRLDLLRQVVPNLRRLGIMGNRSFSDAALEMAEVEAAARTIRLETRLLDVRQGQDITTMFDTMRIEVDALYVVTDSLVNTFRSRIITLALGAHLPTTFNTREYVRAGGLMAYGPDYADQFRRAADYVDKILRGTKPGDLPVEQPTKFDLAINQTTAKALGLTVPSQLLVTADEVIE